MLPVPNLDDRLFEEFVAEARRKISKLYPQWTDENAHDPGMTLVELFAWLTEMQLYYLNRVTVKNELKFLKLLGVKVREAASARVDVTFDGVTEPLRLPTGTKLTADGLPFETERSLMLLPVRLEKVLVHAEAETFDYTSANESVKSGFAAFGAQAKRGSRLLLGFDRPLPRGQLLALMVNLADDYPVKIAPSEEGEPQVVPSAKTAWTFYDGGVWHPLDVAADETAEMSRSGSVVLRVPREMKATRVHPAHEKPRYWLCCTLEEAGYELPPRMEQVQLNTVGAVQQDTRTRVLTFDGTGEAGQAIEIDHYLAFFEQVEVQVRKRDGTWRDWRVVSSEEECSPEESACWLVRETETLTTRVIFAGKAAPAREGNVRVVCCAREFAEARWLGRTNGLPGQRLELPEGRWIAGSLLLQVGEPSSGREGFVWRDWEIVEDLEHSGAEDFHVVVDRESGEVVFGNNEQGLVPDAMESPNVRVLSLQVGGGARGNVQKGLVTAFAASNERLRGLEVTNHLYARGGADAETLAEAKLRVRQEWKKPTRAVTASDYEAIALATPGLRVARVKAIPLYRVGMRDYPQRKAQGLMTLVVVPYNEELMPKPSAGFLETVKTHVDKHRLLTTEVQVVAPAYVQVTVHAVVVVDPAYADQAQKVIAALRRYLDPLNDDNHSVGWEFGKPVHKGDVYGLIHQLPGVEYIQDLWLEATGEGAWEDGNGDVHLPPHGLVYSGAHEVEMISWTQM